jgi:SAM-dependent methyltransferase
MLKRVFACFKSRRRCPVCGKSVDRFLPLPPSYRENAEKYGYRFFGQGETINIESYACPHCGASDRERLYALYLDELPAIPRDGSREKMLHIAPETALADHIRRMGRFEYRSADRSMEAADDQIDIADMEQYQDSAFDCFICSHVLEHVTDDQAALAELFRILAPDGWGILMVPLMAHIGTTIEDPEAKSEADRWRLFGQGDHVRLYAKQDFLRRICSAGFVVEQLGAAHFGSDRFVRAGIADGSVLYILRKPR